MSDKINQAELQEEIIDIVDSALDGMFQSVHALFETKSGDITPTQQDKLDTIKEDLGALLIEQVKQNL